MEISLHLQFFFTVANKWILPITFEPPPEKKNDCVPSEDSDQPGHLPSLIRVFAMRFMNSLGPKRQRRLLSDWANDRVMCPKDAAGIANSVDPDQTALVWVGTVCPDLSVRKLRIITVSVLFHCFILMVLPILILRVNKCSIGSH